MDTTLSKAMIVQIISSLNMKINYIQTGDPAMSADSAKSCGKATMIQPLSDDQMRVILSMRDTIKAFTELHTNHKEVRLIGV